MVKQLEREGGEGRYTGGARGGRREKQLEREGGEGRYTGGARGGRREKQLEREGGEGRCTGEARGGRRENQEPKNWRQVSERELTRQGPVCRSRYQAVSAVLWKLYLHILHIGWLQYFLSDLLHMIVHIFCMCRA